MATTKRRVRRGHVGQEIFAQVQKLVADEGIGRTEAFRRLAKKTGRRQGTVAANYYRIARRSGVKLAKRRRHGGGTDAVGVVVKRALSALDEVTSLFRRLEGEVVRLRQENKRLAAIRRLIGRS
jgi:hypothetical protein